ncbi:unnamed protein product [Ectocarpus sp. CCAP 1310/34]|nr:unnamed protein product [Ectocarpus sp. CCAP 1310/34]
MIQRIHKTIQDAEARPYYPRYSPNWALKTAWYEGDTLVTSQGWNALSILGQPRLSQWRTASDSCEVPSVRRVFNVLLLPVVDVCDKRHHHHLPTPQPLTPSSLGCTDHQTWPLILAEEELSSNSSKFCFSDYCGEDSGATALCHAASMDARPFGPDFKVARSRTATVDRLRALCHRSRRWPVEVEVEGQICRHRCSFRASRPGTIAVDRLRARSREVRAKSEGAPRMSGIECEGTFSTVCESRKHLYPPSHQAIMVPTPTPTHRYKYVPDAHKDRIKGSFGVYGPGAFVHYIPTEDRGLAESGMEELEANPHMRIRGRKLVYVRILIELPADGGVPSTHPSYVTFSTFNSFHTLRNIMLGPRR